MERDALANLLDHTSSTATATACRTALLAGAELRIWGGGAPADQMLPAYQRRQVATASAGTATIGFPEALAALRHAGSQRVHLAQVTTTEPEYLYLVFLAGEPMTVIACIRIDKDNPGL
jgi:hypothetical protein